MCRNRVLTARENDKRKSTSGMRLLTAALTPQRSPASCPRLSESPAYAICTTRQRSQRGYELTNAASLSPMSRNEFP